jgi:hypothetical protein
MRSIDKDKTEKGTRTQERERKRQLSPESADFAWRVLFRRYCNALHRYRHVRTMTENKIDNEKYSPDLKVVGVPDRASSTRLPLISSGVLGLIASACHNFCVERRRVRFSRSLSVLQDRLHMAQMLQVVCITC